MSVESDMVAKLAANAGIAALVGTRIYPLFAPEDAAVPYIVYQLVSRTRIVTAANADGNDPMFRLTYWATTYEGAVAGAAAILAGFQATSGTWGSTAVGLCYAANESDAMEASPELLEKQLYGRQIDLQLLLA